MKKILFIDSTHSRVTNGAPSGVGYYRLINPAKYITKYEVDVKGGDEIALMGENATDIYKKIFQEYDAVVCKPVDEPQSASNLCWASDYYKKPLIVDLDDNYLKVRPDQPGYQFYHPGSQKSAIFRAFVSLASHTITSTQPLADWFENWFKKEIKKKRKIIVLPNYNDLDEFNFKYKGNSDKNIVRIGWQGSTTHMSDLQLVAPALKELLKKYKNLRIEFMGGMELAQAKEYFKDWTEEDFNRVVVTGGTKSWNGYPKKLSTKKWDIGICPLIDDEFNRNKSHIKWMEYAAYNIPCVASKVYPYFKDIHGVKTIQEGKTGFLAKDTKEWVKKLSKLIESKELREEIGRNAYEDIKKNWQMKDNAQKWEEYFDSILK